MLLTQNIRLTILLLLLVGTVGCDQTTKHLARVELRQPGFITLPGGFGELRLANNPGAFLNFGDSLPKPWRLMLFIVSVGAGLLSLLIYLAFGHRLPWLSFIGLGLAWAGGTSNLIDRLTCHGLVSDFIYLHVGPFHTGIFNLADAVILFGITLLTYDLWRRRHQRIPTQLATDRP